VAVEAHLKLGRIRGIEIRLHLSWFALAVLLLLSLAGHFQATHPEWGHGVVGLSAIVTTLLFFVTLLLHELSHAAVATRHGLPVDSITLFALGGVARIRKDAAEPRTEFWMALVGPAVSALIGAGCLALGIALGWSPGTEPATPPVAMLVWLGYINVSLAVFNMIPGFPLDGGRVLRASLWWLTRDADRSTRAAALVGQVVGGVFVIGGLLRFFRGEAFAGLWIAFIGWFLMNAAGASLRQSETWQRLRGVRVGDVMARDCQPVDGRTSLQEFVDGHLLRAGTPCFIVVEAGRAAGLITSQEVKGVRRERWPYVTVEEVMQPLDRLKAVSPETPLRESLEAMVEEDVHQLPVVDDGRLEGVVSRGSILGFLRTRAELNL
jgi:Zn-dependent protease/predicted transcriptional regulator